LHETPNAFIYTTQDDVEKAWDEKQDLMTKIEVEQHFDNGEPKGVRIGKVLPDSVFEKTGAYVPIIYPGILRNQTP